MTEKYPEGSRVSNWTIINEKITWKGHEPKIVPVIRRVVYLPGEKKPLQERLAAKKYAHLRDNERSLKDFVLRLNRRTPEVYRTKKAVEFKHAFINEKLLEEYLSYLIATIPTEAVAKSEFYALKTHALAYFINKLNLADPVDWKRKESLWTQALLNRRQDKAKTPPVWEDNKDRSPTLIKGTVQALNRFMRWLNKRDMHTYPLILFDPVTAAQMKDLKARRVLNGDAIIRKMVRKESWEHIKESSTGFLNAALNLAYHYGLRRNEVLGLQKEDVRQGWINLQRQLKKFTIKGGPKYGPLKGRDARTVPHWFCTAKQAYAWIEEIEKGRIDPRDFSELASKFFDRIEEDHTMHDFRHTWTSFAVRSHTTFEVMKAAGHKDLNTTNKYLHMGEEYDKDAPYIPN